MKTLYILGIGLLALLSFTLCSPAKPEPTPLQPEKQIQNEITYNGLTAAEHDEAHIYALRMTARLP